ncbi:MAG: serpin family protein [Planctomycetota bacterium]
MNTTLTLATALLFATLRTVPAQETDPERLSAALNQFAAELHAKLPAADAALCSPFSVATVLLELLPGARGTTADEFAAVLHLPADLRGDRLLTAVQRLVTALTVPTTKSKDHIDLAITNDLWRQRGTRLLPAYEQALKQHLAVGMNEQDFAADCERARRAINAHIARATNDRIPELLAPGLLTPDTAFVATNAIWLRGKWVHEFYRPEKPAPFHVTADRTVDASMMHLTTEMLYAEHELWQAASLPLLGGDIVFDVVVPTAKGKLADAVAAALGAETWKAAQYSSVQLSMPAFRVRTAPDLTAVLAALGLRDAFSRERADFSGIATKPPIFVDRVVHGAWLAVDENGVEAAAATAAVLKAGAAAPSQPKILHADHPFAFALRDTRTGLILFVGFVEDPTRGA